jgi:hypothetical protein
MFDGTNKGPTTNEEYVMTREHNWDEMTPEYKEAWKAYQLMLAERYQEKQEAKAKEKAIRKLAEDYAGRFGFVGGQIDDERQRLMALSLETGVDHLVDAKRRNQEWMEKRAREHEEFLARPITPEMVTEYTQLIKRRRLYEGACDLSWQRYFEYVEGHPEVALTSEDREYAGMWTSCARRG